MHKLPGKIHKIFEKKFLLMVTDTPSVTCEVFFVTDRVSVTNQGRVSGLNR